MQLQKATRRKSKLRLNISGPAGSGKTYSALLMSKGLVGSWEKIAVIDTENGSASLYDHLGPFQALDLQQPFSPERYMEAIDICIKAGMECIIIDSSTHEWNGPGGCIDINERLAQSKFKGNTWSAWSQTTPRHDAFVQKVLQCPVHVITCTRSKMETVMTDDKKVKKLGMKDMQREGWEYELTVSLNIDRDTHTATASKDRTELFEGLDPFVITEATGNLIKDWCEKGIEATDAMALAIKAQAATAPPLEPVKQPLSEKAFLDGVARIKNGEPQIGPMIKEKFALTIDQISQLDAALLATETPVTNPE